MEGSCSTGQSPQLAVVPVEEEEEYQSTPRNIPEERGSNLNCAEAYTHANNGFDFVPPCV
jgi:hypothetical protein